MFSTFFFIPSNNKKFINKGRSLETDYIIYDLEDSITQNEINISVENLKDVIIKDNIFVRPSFFDNKHHINKELLINLLEIGFKNYLVPKVESIDDIIKIKKFYKETVDNINQIRFFLLVENPRVLLDLEEIVKKNFLNICWVGLGNQDYCNFMNMKNNIGHLAYARHHILNVTKAYNIEAVDIVSMDLYNDNLFCEEVINGFELGFNGKLVIHPKQLNLVKNIKFFTEEEIIEAKYLYEEIKKIEEDEVALLKIGGKVYEKPHIQQIKRIVNWSLKHNI